MKRFLLYGGSVNDRKHEDLTVLGNPRCRSSAGALSWQVESSRKGLLPLGDVDGAFALIERLPAGQEKPSEQTFVTTDRYASLPLFTRFSSGASSWAVGEDPKEVAGSGSRTIEFDQIAAIQWIICGYIPSRRTLYRGVQSLPYATTLCMQSGIAERYWSVHDRPVPVPLENAGMVERLHDLENASIEVAARAPGPHTVLLSGGWDSRAMVTRLSQFMTKERIFGYTFGPQNSNDTRIAAQLAERLGIVYSSRDYDHGDASEGIEKWARVHGDLADNVFVTLPEGPRQLSGLSRSRLWLGTDSFSTVLPETTSSILNLPGSPRHIALLTGAIASKVLDPRWLVAMGAKPETCEEAFQEISALIEAEDDLPFDKAFDRLSHATRFRVWNINRSLFQSVADVETPFHDADLVEYYASLPQRLRGQRRAHKLANPSHGDIPYSSGELHYDFVTRIRSDGKLRLAMLEVVQKNEAVADLIDTKKLSGINATSSTAFVLFFLRAFMVCVTFSSKREYL